jgi:diaminohydroxyphosphoribosylaminopyrimidine deaminase/5-amino-6-(5-phosphoribosylamino)uracil reductase
MNDSDYMRRAVRLAKKGTGKVSPNPRVGCVVVRDGEIVAEGHHAVFGGPHAEQAALAGLDERLSRNATLYTTLEPCDHTGKTPPCSRAIVRAGIGRVVIGCRDPNPIVNGRGIRRLREAGIEVSTGVLEEECRRLNEAYFKYILTRKPFVTVKIAQTLDGRIATPNGDSKWISGEKSRRLVHGLRGEHDAVLVGVATVIRDDPELTVRNADGKRLRGFSPRRIVLDSRLRIPLKSKLLRGVDPERTILATTERASAAGKARLESRGARVWTLRHDRSGGVSIPSLLKEMAENGMTSVLVEGGCRIFTAFLKSGEVDRLIVFTSPSFFGAGVPSLGDLGIRDPACAGRFKSFNWNRVGHDMMFTGEKPCLPESSKK